MDDSLILARQVRQITILEDEVKNLKSKISEAKAIMNCAGGPLNDNNLGYTKEQLRTFSLIFSALSN